LAARTAPTPSSTRSVTELHPLDFLKRPQDVWEAVHLTDYAVETRYPGRVEPVTEDEYREAVALADRVVQWAEQILSERK